MKSSLYFFVTLMLFSFALQAQITSPNADGVDVTNYPVFTQNDSIYIFCASDSVAHIGNLLVTTELAGTKTFLWEKYNEELEAFEPYSEETSDDTTSQIVNLENGCYRSTINLGDETEISRAWIFNNWTVADGYVSDSNCESFRLNGEFKTAVLNYYDLSDNTKLEVFKDVNAEWLLDGAKLSSKLNLQIFDQPYKNTDYTLHVFDKYDCGAYQNVTYESIVTKAKYSVDANWTDVSRLTGEAPLTVTFTNQSENGSEGYYEWFFYRDIDEITQESEGATEPVDSIDFVAYDESPVYTYQNSGAYWVKLVSKHVSDFYTCVDTFALDEFIIADTSFVRAPNVFTPNGDGVNDQFVVWFFSMKSVEINIYDRWGHRVHFWESGDVQGFEGAMPESVWDGKIGGRYASPGVYYYDVVGRGRDGEKRKKNGFVHLFRDKD